jgi:UDP-N-acetylmuramyl pentapeptide phosphotransferase/UDP-N-acetylglucosamine-1-phosphate transferase
MMLFLRFSASIVVTYGYLDDRFELRPIVKLTLQISSVCLFAMLESRVLFPKWSALAFVVISFWGLGVLNGSNLLDGLDTLTIKLGSVTFISYLVIAWNFSIGSVALGSLVVLSTLAAFYFFNKEPAKIHLGEIGGSFIGFSSLLVSCFVYSYLSRLKIDSVNSMSMALLPLCLPMVELGVSFLRRLYNRKSPFKGDKYHLHHLLRNYYGFSPSTASSVFAGGYAVIMALSFTATHFLGPLFGIFFCVSTMTISYIAVGKKHWSGSDTLNLKPAALFDYLLKKDVGVINSLEVDGFELEIIGSFDGPLSEDLSQESVFSEEEESEFNDEEEEELISKKKAA